MIGKQNGKPALIHKLQKESLEAALDVVWDLCPCACNEQWTLESDTFSFVSQASSQSMPWLADLVQSSEGSLDVLPVQCLCEFLLHDAADDSLPLDDDEDGESKEQKAKKRQVLQQTFFIDNKSMFLKRIWVEATW